MSAHAEDHRALDRAPAHHRQQRDERERRPPDPDRARRRDLGQRRARRPVDERSADRQRDEHVIRGLQSLEQRRRRLHVVPEATDVPDARPAAVAGGDDELRHRPAANRARRRACAPRPTGPWSSTSPSPRTIARSATPSANAIWCVVSRTAVPLALASSSNSTSSACDGGSRPTTGSSSTSSFAGRISAHAKPVFCLRPRESSAGRKSARCERPRRSSSAVDPLLDPVVGDAVRERDERQVLPDREVVVEHRRVGNERQRGASRLGVRLAVRIVAADPHRALGRLQQPRDRPDRGGLPRAVGADQRHALAALELEVEMGEADEAAVVAGQPGDLQGDRVGGDRRGGGHPHQSDGCRPAHREARLTTARSSGSRVLSPASSGRRTAS